MIILGRVLGLGRSIITTKLSKMSSVDIGDMRMPYRDLSSTFGLEDLASKEPLGQFKSWFDEASRPGSGVEEANAMCLATADVATGMPSARMVLLKEFGKEGFVFYTNYGSRKGQEIEGNPNVALMFYWEPLKRSIRIEGKVAKVSREKSEEYFHSRPFGSQIGAAVSDQSRVVASRAVLTDREAALKKDYDNNLLPPMPGNWGGYLVVPHTFEFWQGQSTRIHDRLRFRKRCARDEDTSAIKMWTEGEEGWIIERLSP